MSATELWQRTDPELRIGVVVSASLHVLAFLFFTVKGTFFPHESRYIPTLRVDVVDLPEILKKDKEKIHSKTGKELKVEEEKKVPEKKTAEKEQVKKRDMTLVKKKKRKVKIQSALERAEVKG